MQQYEAIRTKMPVLVIEDDPAQRKTLAAILEDEGWKTVCQSTGEAGLAAANTGEFAVAVLDLRLPDLDGLEVLKALQQEMPKIKVIIHTGYATVESAMAAVNQGAFAYMRKMGDVDELLSHIHRAFLTWYSEKLEQELKVRSEELVRINNELELRVQERTARLLETNVRLKREIQEKQRIADQLLAHQDKLRSLSSELVLTEERERRRLATDLHDRIGQALAISKMKLSALQSGLANRQEDKVIAEITGLIDQIIQDTRTLTFELSPSLLYELGLEAALEWLAEKIAEQHDITILFENDKTTKPLNHNGRVVLFRAVRELLYNVIKHARAQNAKIRLKQDSDFIYVSVSDDGKGFDKTRLESRAAQTKEFGIFSIRERLNMLGGNIALDSTPGSGTTVELMVPIANVEAQDV